MSNPSAFSLQPSTFSLSDFFLTLLYWTWFIPGFFLFFSWRYLACALFSQDREQCFQRLNSRFFQVFFRIIRFTAPSHTWEIDQEAAAIRSGVIVCNHLSYLDPLLLIALFERHRTIVKTRFFSMPVFGRIIKQSGYFPAGSEGPFAGMMLKQMATMGNFLAQGGNLFIFPEGTRSRDGRLGDLNQGAMKIARLCKAPIYVLRLAHTDHLFAPGKFLFQTSTRNTVTLKLLARIAPDYEQHMPSTTDLEQQIQATYRTGL
jgi:1-acyl-sn-glycerol-3-phosphate acyltransferase